MKFLLLSIIFQLLFWSTEAQKIDESDFTDDFAFSIQTIDDFFDRFNFDPSTPAIQYINSNFPEFKFNKKTVIFSLFNFKSTLWDKMIINEFADQFANDTIIKLKFDEKGWYSVLHCDVFYKKKRRKMDLIMEIDSVHTQKGTIGYKWSIRSIKATFINALDTSTSINTPSGKKNESLFLHPMSHAINFINIRNIFKKGLTNVYFAKEVKPGSLNKFKLLVDKSEIKFNYIDSVSFEIFQLPGWILEVKQFNRSGRNSGWLISKLVRASDLEKQTYLNTELNIR